jgi:cytochrome c oxidase subunit 1
MSVALPVLVPPLPAAPASKPRNYLNQSEGLKSWLLTQDHKRIAILYLIGVTFFFLVSGLLVFILRRNSLLPISMVNLWSITGETPVS